MSAILGIDAAWTPRGSSGVALIKRTDTGHWKCVAVEASYRDFVTLSSIHGELSREIAGIDFEIPETSGNFSDLKLIEDKIDALVCA
jgi:predicted RNase H-like nuclease